MNASRFSDPSAGVDAEHEPFSSARSAGMFRGGELFVLVSGAVALWITASSSGAQTLDVAEFTPLLPVIIGAIVAGVANLDARRLSRRRYEVPRRAISRLLSPQSLKGIASQLGIAPLSTMVVVYGAVALDVASAVRFQILSSNSVGQSQPVHAGPALGPAGVVFGVAAFTGLLALLGAGLFHLRTTLLPRHLARNEPDPDPAGSSFSPGQLGWTSLDVARARSVQRARWDVNTNFSQRVRRLLLWIAAASVAVASVDLVVHHIARH